jgi:hypothetical protein
MREYAKPNTCLAVGLNVLPASSMPTRVVVPSYKKICVKKQVMNEMRFLAVKVPVLTSAIGISVLGPSSIATAASGRAKL